MVHLSRISRELSDSVCRPTDTASYCVGFRIRGSRKRLGIGNWECGIGTGTRDSSHSYIQHKHISMENGNHHRIYHRILVI